ncbi:MAG: DNA-processing protein DprA [Candidatus Sumerlaeaceae bacterium]
MTETAETKRWWLTLRLVPQMSRVRFYTLIDHFQTPEAVFSATATEIASLPGFDEALARAVLVAPHSPAWEAELAEMERRGVRLLTLDDEEYPENLRVSSFPPPLLFLKGTLDAMDRFAVAVIGSRRATQYGRAVAQEFAGRLARAGLAIVSGFARGVDSVAHRAALDNGGRTIAVLGNGLSVCYPQENAHLADAIAQRGALVTEYPMKTPPDRFNFPERNHLIAALALGTLVVEAAEKSGALITAREALEENRFVFAVPGDITRENSRGTNALIQSGAKLVQSADDVLAEMRHQLRGLLRGVPQERCALSEASALPDLTPEEETVYDLLRHEPQCFDVLLARLDSQRFGVQELASVLLSLEMKRCIKQLPGRIYAVLQ